MSPPLDCREQTLPVITHAQKCETLRKHLFPEPPNLENELAIDLEHNNEDIEYMSVTRREVGDPIVTAAQMNAPGISGLMARAWRWAWSVIEDAMYHLVRLCADLGYHPKTWRMSITVTL